LITLSAEKNDNFRRNFYFFQAIAIYTCEDWNDGRLEYLENLGKKEYN
jgi:hypothetical protein